jgi:predicted HTH domain antitoxin
MRAGSMRDPGRIPMVMAKLQAIWERYPGMRLGQLLIAVIQANETDAGLFHLEDDRLVEMLEGFVGRGDVGSMPSFVEHLLVIPKDPAEAKMAIAAKMFELKLISSGQAAQILGIRRVDFLLSLHRMGTPVIDLTEEDLISDIRNARTELVNGLEADLLRNGEPTPTLDEMIASITSENQHPLIDFGPDIGREVMDFDYELTEEDKLILAFAKRQHLKRFKEDGGWDNSPEHPEPEIYTDERITEFLAEDKLTLNEKDWELFQKILERAPKPLNKKLEKLLKGHERSGEGISETVVARAIEVFETRENALQWLNSPIPALGGQVPADLLKTPEGTKLVLAVLIRIEYGVYS